MSRRQTIEVKCDRCKRIEYVPAPNKKDVGAAPTLHVKGVLLNIKVLIDFEDLCSPCEKTVKNLVDSIIKVIKGKSPDRNSDAKKEGDESPSISTQPQSSAAS